MTGAEPSFAAREPLQGRWTRSRPVVGPDLPFLYSLLVDPAVGTTFRYQGATPSFDDFAHHAWDGVLAQWVVAADDTQQLLGFVVVSSPDFRNGYAFLSVVAAPDTVGSGVMMDGTAAVIDHVFQCWPFRQLYFEASEDSFRNFASGLGRFFVEEGRRRAQLFANGRYQDVHLLTLTRERWAEEAAPMWQRLLRGATGASSVSPP